MGLICSKFMKKLFNARFFAVFLFLIISFPARANWGIIDSLDLSPFIPIVLDSLMSISSSTYNFFVGKGDGIIYIIVWGWMAVYMGMYLIKLYFPKTWISFFGFNGGGEVFEGNITGMQIGINLLKPALRAVIAATFLLQVKPIYVTEWIVNPFLQFGSLYTQGIVETINTTDAKPANCSEDIEKNGWISKSSCEFLVKPVAQMTHENNKIIKRGFEFINQGLLGLITLVPHGKEDFLNIITGIVLVFAFVSSNFFIALLIIQGIFNFGMALLLYPFKVITYVVTKSEDWVNPWPAFEGIINSLRELVITMIACAFILIINIAIIKSLFNWNSSVFVPAAGGFATSNIPTIANQNAMGFGQHSVLWISAILTFYLMFKIFELTKQKLAEYSGNQMTGLYNQTKSDFNAGRKRLETISKTLKEIFKDKK